MTHAELVERACRWLRNTKRCSVVVAEYAMHGEIPDVFGIGPGGTTILAECKVSRRDFMADKRKIVRRVPHRGVGILRYYLTPPGLVSTADLPDDWGLLEKHGRLVKVIREAEAQESNFWKEHYLAFSLLRRVDAKIRPAWLHDWIKTERPPYANG